MTLSVQIYHQWVFLLIAVNIRTYAVILVNKYDVSQYYKPSLVTCLALASAVVANSMLLFNIVILFSAVIPVISMTLVNAMIIFILKQSLVL